MSTATLCALIIFAITYILVFSLEKYRPYIAVGSAILFMMLGTVGILPDFSYGFLDGIKEIDWNVLMMIAGTMGTVQLFIDSGMPQLMSDILISKVSSVKWMILVMSLFAGIISAFVDNVATVLMIAPVALAVCKKLNISPVSTIICISISSNLQGAATLVGDTTSILLAKAAGLDFMDFFFVDGKFGMFWITEAGAVAAALIILLMFRNENQKIDMNERTAVDDKVPTYILCATVLCLILASFIPYKDAAAPGQFYKPDITNGLICMTFFVIGLIRQSVKDGSTEVARKSFKELDYYTIFLLAGLFIVIGAIKKAGVIDLLARGILSLCGGSIDRTSFFVTYSIIVWMSVLISAFIDNIPYTATMLPVVASLSAFFNNGGYTCDPNVLFFGLLVGATLGGNLTPVGASANIAGIGILRKEGCEVKPKDFMKYSVPFTLTAVTTGYLLVWLIFA